MDADEIIVSKTDLKGRITYGNSTFMKYAGFPETDLIGIQHNIIRHPDMPRGVFKLFWDTLHQGQEIFAFVKNISMMPQGVFKLLWSTLEQGQEVFAFVKNLAADGSFYWVFANVTPSLDVSGQVVGYYSVRRKASRNSIEAVTALYRRMRQIEQAAPSRKDGMDQSLAWVEQQLQAMNQRYEQFVLGLQY